MINHFALIKFSGSDVRNFLQGQITQDINRVSAGQAQFTAYCNHQGRLQATGVLWSDSADSDRSDENIYFLVHRSIATDITKRLSMYVLRADVKVNIAKALIAPSYENENDLTNGGIPHFPLLHCDSKDSLFSIGFPSPDPNKNRKLTIKIAEEGQAQTDENEQLSEESLRWISEDIRSGLAWVTKDIYGLFLAQNLNLDSINAISFSKGCYTGQEVIARLHYKSSPKKRAYPLKIKNLDISDGQDLSIDGTLLGTVINSVTYDRQQFVLAEMPIAEVETLKAGDIFELLPLPYPL